MWLFLFVIVLDSLTEHIQKIAWRDIMFAGDVALCNDTCENVEDHLEKK